MAPADGVYGLSEREDARSLCRAHLTRARGNSQLCSRGSELWRMCSESQLSRLSKGIMTGQEEAWKFGKLSPGGKNVSSWGTVWGLLRIRRWKHLPDVPSGRIATAFLCSLHFANQVHGLLSQTMGVELSLNAITLHFCFWGGVPRAWGISHCYIQCDAFPPPSPPANLNILHLLQKKGQQECLKGLKKWNAKASLLKLYSGTVARLPAPASVLFTPKYTRNLGTTP